MIYHSMHKTDDCFRACVATVLQTPLYHDVPHFLAGKKMADDWWPEFVEWCESIGIRPSTGIARSRYLPSGIPYILVGTSPRNGERDHAVVATEAGMLHDPHTSKEGILDPSWYIQLSVESFDLYNDWVRYGRRCIEG